MSDLSSAESDDDSFKKTPPASTPSSGASSPRKRASPLSDDDDDDEDVIKSGSKRQRHEPEPTNNDPDSDDDLFGDEDKSVRSDGLAEDLDEDGEVEAREQIITLTEVVRHAQPKGDDGELYLLRMPPFMGIEPEEWNHERFQPPTTEHHSILPPTKYFSAANTAASTIRWRHSPNDPSKLESNARILRWSDGSLTVQLASDPLTQYEIGAKPLAPPQQHPTKNTPVSRLLRAVPGKPPPPVPKYDEAKDSFTYLSSADPGAGLLRTTNKLTAQLSVKATGQVADEAELILTEKLKAAKGGKSGIQIIEISEDPGLARQRAEMAEREKARMARKRENLERKEHERLRGIGGTPRRPRVGLTANLLEGGMDEDTYTTPAAKRKPRSSRARMEEEEDEEEEEEYRSGRRQDEYDKEDDFLADSDEEEEVIEDDEDDEMEEAAEEEERRRRSHKDRRGSESKGKRRRVVDDDDDDDDDE